MSTASSFERRMERAVAFECAVRDAITERGWYAEPFGQAQLTSGMRDALRLVQPSTLVRWMPDIIAAKNFGGRQRVIYVDAKAGDKWRTTGRHDFEVNAVESAHRWVEYSNCPTYFVCSDWSVFTPDIVREVGQLGSYRGSGSGTPFLLVRAAAGMRFDALFPAQAA
jgi:hypothetical protein